MTDTFKTRELLDAITKGPVVENSPKEAMPARKCKCPDPWLERDADDQLHCVRCGLDWGVQR